MSMAVELEQLSPGSDSLVNCRCKDGTASPRCCKKLNSRGRGSSRVRSTSGRSPSYSTLGRASGSSYRRMQKGGKFLQQLGLAQMANAHLSMPDTSGKIWTPLERRERHLHGTSHERSHPRKYDWRPKGERINPGNTKSAPVADYRYRKLRGREAHWARRPKYNQGIYSQPTISEIHHHRKSQTRRGQAKVAVGSGMRFLGTGLLAFQLGVYGYWLYDDPSEKTVTKIVKDITLVEQIDQLLIQPWADFLDPGRNIGS